MAARFPDPPRRVDPIEDQINYFFDRIVMCVNARRMFLLATAEGERNAKIETLRRRIVGEKQLGATKEEIERIMEENILQETQQLILREVERKLAEMRIPLPETRVVFRGDYGHLEQLIASFGEIQEEEVQVVPRYEVMRPIVAVGKKGKAPGELWHPNAVAIDSNTNYIYVAEGDPIPFKPRLSIFSDGGEFLKSYKLTDLNCPYGIAVHANFIYITDIVIHVVFQFTINFDIHLVTKFGNHSYDCDFRDFTLPYNLAVCNNGEVYVTDCCNNRIQIIDSSLNSMRTLTKERIRQPYDVKLTANSVYVLCGVSPYIRVFSYTGEMLRTLIARDNQLVNRAFHFCLDSHENITISDYDAHNIKAFTKEGIPIHTIGKEGNEIGMFKNPKGLALNNELNLVVLSGNDNYGLQIFSSL